MNDQDLSDKIRKLAARFRQQMEPHTPLTECKVWECAAEAVESLLPTPTLADMTPVARRGCQWMQCEVRGERRIITLILDDNEGDYVVTLDSSGYTSHCLPEYVTPLPDLPRMTWPVPDLNAEDANTVKIGAVIESADDPRIPGMRRHENMRAKFRDIRAAAERVIRQDNRNPDAIDLDELDAAIAAFKAARDTTGAMGDDYDDWE